MYKETKVKCTESCCFTWIFYTSAKRPANPSERVRESEREKQLSDACIGQKDICKSNASERGAQRWLCMDKKYPYTLSVTYLRRVQLHRFSSLRVSLCLSSLHQTGQLAEVKKPLLMLHCSSLVVRFHLASFAERERESLWLKRTCNVYFSSHATFVRTVDLRAWVIFLCHFATHRAQL